MAGTVLQRTAKGRRVKLIADEPSPNARVLCRVNSFLDRQSKRHHSQPRQTFLLVGTGLCCMGTQRPKGRGSRNPPVNFEHL